MLRRISQVLADGIAHPTLPVFAQAAGGGVIVDVDGNSLIDLGSGIAVTTVGNAHPGVVAAIQEQVARFTHTCAMVVQYDSYLELAERLVQRYPGLPASDVRVAFFNSGAEAIENAVKIARAATNRSAVITLDHAFHGRTNLTLAMTAKAHPYKSGFGPFAGEVYRLPGSYPYHDNLTGEQAGQRWISLAESLVGGSNVAAVVVEPLQGEGGFIEPAAGFLAAVSHWCQRSGAILVADEIQSGIGRTGDFFASEHEQITPDLIAVAKGLGGGMPLSGVLGRSDVVNAVRPGGIGGTYGGNPAACAAALAVLDAIEQDNLLERARQIGHILTDTLTSIANSDGRIGQVRGRGAMVAIEIVEPETLVPDSGLAKEVAAYCAGHGVLVLTCGTYGNVIRLLPPLSIPDSLLIEALGILGNAFTVL
jgi:4-aminobutyrate aminotransferase/(S)-3-amino-2-methylpropionate transaminase